MFVYSKEAIQQIGALVREKRLERGLSVRHFAKRVNSNPSSISRMERGLRGMKLAKLREIIAYLNLEVSESVLSEYQKKTITCPRCLARLTV